jgi:hypothetical protein
VESWEVMEEDWTLNGGFWSWKPIMQRIFNLNGYTANSASFINFKDIKQHTKEAGFNQKEHYRFLVNGTRLREGAKSE